MTAERLADDYAPILLSGVRIRRLRLRNSFCPSSSSATLNGRPHATGDQLPVAGSRNHTSEAARGWLQRLVRSHFVLRP